MNGNESIDEGNVTSLNENDLLDCLDGLGLEDYVQYDDDNNSESDDSADNNFEVEDTVAKALVIVKTQRDKHKLYYGGYFYTIENDVGVPPNNKITWKCERTGNQRTVRCSGRAYSINFYEPVLETIEHNHEPEPEKLKCLQAIDRIKIKATITNDNPRSIIKQCETCLDDESAVKMKGHKNYIKS